MICTVIFCLVFTAPAKLRIELRAKISQYRNRCFSIVDWGSSDTTDWNRCTQRSWTDEFRQAPSVCSVTHDVIEQESVFERVLCKFSNFLYNILFYILFREYETLSNGRFLWLLKRTAMSRLEKEYGSKGDIPIFDYCSEGDVMEH